jgi:hypothetical protein
MTRGKYFSGWTGGIHSIYLYAQHKKDDDLAKIFVMYLAVHDGLLFGD